MLLGRLAMDPHLGTGCRISSRLGRVDAFSDIGALSLTREAALGTNIGAIGIGVRARGEKHFTEAALAGLLIDLRDCLEVDERKGGKAVT